MSISSEDEAAFRNAISDGFGFLESQGMKFHGVRSVGKGDPRDESLVARYSNDELRVDIGFNPIEGSLAVLLKFNRSELLGNDKFVYLEPFVEFQTKGEVQALVPYIKENMTIRQLENAMKERVEVFEGGFVGVMLELGRRMEDWFAELLSVPSKNIQDYHNWMKT